MEEGDVFNAVYHPLVSLFDQADKWFCRPTEHWQYLLTLTEPFSCLLRAQLMWVFTVIFNQTSTQRDY